MKAWRESASLILAAKHGQKYNCSSSLSNFQYNYQLLCLKRHQKSSFMPGSYVFPGGVIHPADADLKWEELFSGFGYSKHSFTSLIPQTGTRTNILKAQSNELPREISLRITTIRETFEECGVLLCARTPQSQRRSDWATHMDVTQSELLKWQEKVHNDATEFYSLCKTLECYPNLWSLHEWSNWFTPTYFTGKRFDTIFYLACMPYIPNADYEEKEMEDLQWDIPTNYVDPSSTIMLGPPQFYEISRIANFENIDNLLNFAVERSKIGVQLSLPVKVQLKDGFTHVLPGDSMYPEQLSLSEVQVIDKSDLTLDEFRKISPVKNRMEMLSLNQKKIWVDNLKSAEGHLPPIEIEDLQVDTKSKL